MLASHVAFYPNTYIDFLKQLSGAASDEVVSRISSVLASQDQRGGYGVRRLYIHQADLARTVDASVDACRSASSVIALRHIADLREDGEAGFPGRSNVLRVHPGGVYYGSPLDLFHRMVPCAFEIEKLAHRVRGHDADAIVLLDKRLADVRATWPKGVPQDLPRPRWLGGPALSVKACAWYLRNLLSDAQHRYHEIGASGRKPVAGAASLIEHALERQSLMPLGEWLLNAKLPSSLKRRMPGATAVADLVGVAVRDKRVSVQRYASMGDSGSYGLLGAREAYERRLFWQTDLLAYAHPLLEGRWPLESNLLDDEAGWATRTATHLESAMRRARSWSLSEFQALLAHPFALEVVRGLVFVDRSGSNPFVFDAENRPPDLYESKRFRIAHPAEHSDAWPIPPADPPTFSRSDAAAPLGRPDLSCAPPISRGEFVARTRNLNITWLPKDGGVMHEPCALFRAEGFTLTFALQQRGNKITLLRVDIQSGKRWDELPILRAETWRLAIGLAGVELPELPAKPAPEKGRKAKKVARSRAKRGQHITGELGRCSRCRKKVGRTDEAVKRDGSLWHARCALPRIVLARGTCAECLKPIIRRNHSMEMEGFLLHMPCALKFFPEELKKANDAQ